MRKFFYILISLVIFFNLSSCSNINMESTAVSFRFPEEVASIIKAGGDSVPISGGGGNLFTCVATVSGDFSTSASHDYSSLDSLMGSDIVIPGIPADSVVRISVRIIFNSNVIYYGISDPIKVEVKKNEVTVLLAATEPGGAGGGSEEDRYKEARVGDIILEDGTICSLDDYVSGGIAVIVREATDDKSALGCSPFAENMYCYSGLADNPTLANMRLDLLEGDLTSGLTSGKNALEIMQTNYPDMYAYVTSKTEDAFMYCKNYGVTKGYALFEDGWYLPSVAEIKLIDDNIDICWNSLLKLKSGQTLGIGSYITVLSCNSKDYSIALYDFEKHTVTSGPRGNNHPCAAFREFR